MRTFLHKLMVDITRNPRQIVTPGIDFKWEDGNSRIWQIFRAYEYFFGRKLNKDGSTQRFEGGSYKDEFGRDCWMFGTWENVFAFTEGVVRSLFKGLVPQFEIVDAPQFITPSGVMFDSPFRFAIAFDAAQSIASNPTLSCTVTGSNGYMFAMPIDVPSGGSTMTFNGVSMVSSGVVTVPAPDFTNAFYLIAPATGTHNLISSTAGQGVGACTYSGVKQTAPDTFNSAVSSSSPLSVTLTTATANCWAWVGGFAANGTSGALTNLTLRTGLNWGGQQPVLYDSNGVITTGGYTMTVAGMSAQPFNALLAWSFTQVTAAAINSGFFFAVDR